MRAGRRTQVVKGAVCKTAMQRFDPARRLQTSHAPTAGHLFAVSLVRPADNPLQCSPFYLHTCKLSISTPLPLVAPLPGVARWNPSGIPSGAISQARGFTQFQLSFQPRLVGPSFSKFADGRRERA